MRLGYGFKRSQDMASAIWTLKRLSRNERRSPEALAAYQRERFSALLRHAVSHSGLYRSLYQERGLDETAGLEDLPVVDKQTLMDHYDELVTDRRLTMSGVQSHLAGLMGDDYYLGEYRVVTTAGSTGDKAVFAFNRKEWNVAQAAGLRTGMLMGVRPKFPRRLRVATIGSASPLHLSYRLALTLSTGLHEVRRMEATEEIDSLVAALNEFQPDVLQAYPFILGMLACEQLDGGLTILPHVVGSAGEALSGDVVAKVRSAWGTTPFDVYGSTEGLFAVDCAQHRGLHIFEDLTIVEVVDRHNQPVPDGTPGDKLLITSLFGYTQPVIRYEITDIVTVTSDPCPCGRTFRRITSVGGRSDDVLYLQGHNGREVPVAPSHFWGPMEDMHEVKQYQVVQERDGLWVCLVLTRNASQEEVAARTKERFANALEGLGVKGPAIHFWFTDRIEQDPRQLGKMKLVRSNINNGQAA